jgi:hypothetical protein
VRSSCAIVSRAVAWSILRSSDSAAWRLRSRAAKAREPPEAMPPIRPRGRYGWRDSRDRLQRQDSLRETLRRDLAVAFLDLDPDGAAAL